MRLILLLLPWLELFTLIQLGIETSALTALGYVLVTLLLGMALLRRQGRGIFENLRQSQRTGVLGQQLLLDDMALGVAGLLLMFPGLLTDVAAVVVILGPLRRRAVRWLFGPPPEHYDPGRDTQSRETLEGSYRRLDDDDDR